MEKVNWFSNKFAAQSRNIQFETSRHEFNSDVLMKHECENWDESVLNFFSHFRNNPLSATANKIKQLLYKFSALNRKFWIETS